VGTKKRIQFRDKSGEQMIIENLYDEILIKPVKDGGNTLYIVSGYASGALATKHMTQVLETMHKQINIRLVIGMFPQITRLQNIPLNHGVFKRLATSDYPTLFECRYVTETPKVHIKAYAWYKNEQPLCGYLGSANYTQLAFSSRQREAVLPCDAVAIKGYFDTLWDNALDCRESKADQLIADFVQSQQIVTETTVPSTINIINTADTNSSSISLLYKGEVPKSSGLNWGIRGDKPSRPSKDEAYIHVPAGIVKTGFFPDMGEEFNVATDDDRTLTLKLVSGDIGKDLHSVPRNKDIGLYFRNRLNLPSGTLITREHLENYGRTNIKFVRINDEEYFLDFSVS